MSSAQIDFLAGGLTDANGDPYDSVTVEFYESGTSTPVTVYSDAALTSSLGSSTTLNSFGRLLAFFDATVSLKVVVKALTGDEIFDGLQYAINLGENYMKPDGSVPMTGALDMDGRGIDSVGDIDMAAGGRIIFKTGGAWTPGVSDMLVMGGASGYWAARGDADLTLWDDGTKRLTLDSAGKLTLHTGGMTIAGQIDGLTAGATTGDAVEYDQMNTAIAAHSALTSGVHGITSDLVGVDDTQTLTNKTLTSPDINTPDIDGGTADTVTLTSCAIDAATNNLTNIDTTHLAAGILDTDISTTSATDDTLASAKSIKTYVDAQVSGGTGSLISDLAYSALWNGEGAVAPSKNAVYDIVSTLVDNTAYGAGWSGVSDSAPSKDALYDKFESLAAAGYPDTVAAYSGTFGSISTSYSTVHTLTDSNVGASSAYVKFTGTISRTTGGGVANTFTAVKKVGATAFDVVAGHGTLAGVGLGGSEVDLSSSKIRITRQSDNQVIIEVADISSSGYSTAVLVEIQNP